MAEAIDNLKEEHEEIRAMLGILNQMGKLLVPRIAINWDDFDTLLEFFKLYADELHHAKEEDILLPALFAKGFPMKGGPLCTYFKHLQLSRPSLEVEIKSLDHSYYPPPHLENYPIPIVEEHVLGRKLTEAMRMEIFTLKQFPEASRQKLHYLVGRFVELLEEHIDKENRCLFPMTRDTLTPEEMDMLSKKFGEVEKSWQTRPGIPALKEKWDLLKKNHP